MSAGRALRPTVPGKAPGIVDLNPLTLQCAACGRTATNDAGLSIARFIIATRWIFCLLEAGDGIRRCHECQAEHARTCGRCAHA